MTTEAILGLDSSCYTTSAALVSTAGELIGEARRLLEVEVGARGLSQSAALFKHVQNFPAVLEELFSTVQVRVVGVAAGVRPLPSPESYLPVFTVARSVGCSLAAGLGVPYWGFSHQGGHLMAGLWSVQYDPGASFLAVHFSGGTSQVLQVNCLDSPFSLDIRVLGETLDLAAGQLVDRIGVLLGLPFPAGSHLEKLASAYEGELVHLPTCARDFSFSLSGPETQARRLIASGVPAGAVARAVEDCLARVLEKVLRPALVATSLSHVLLAGGVMANADIRRRLRRRLEHRAVGARLLFPAPGYCVDNAVGIALLGQKLYLTSRNSPV